MAGSIPKPAPELNEVAEKVMRALRDKGISVKYDMDMKNRPGFKFAEYELKGIPVRIGMGMRDLENNQLEVARRDTKSKSMVPIEGIGDYVRQLLDEIQANLFQQAVQYRAEHMTEVNDWKTFTEVLEEKGGFASAHWDGTTETELEIDQQSGNHRRMFCSGRQSQPEQSYPDYPRRYRHLSYP